MAGALTFTWDGQNMVVHPRSQKAADERFVIGQAYSLAEAQDRSARSHRHFFAQLREGWLNLPESIAEEFATEEHLRKKLLIRAGYRDERTIVCASNTEARRVAAFCRPMDEYALVSVSGNVVVVLTAQSQSEEAMGPRDFQRSKSDVLAMLADLLGVAPSALARAEAA